MSDTHPPAAAAGLLDQPFRESFAAVETHARSVWAEHKVDACDLDSDKPKRYVLGMFPYPSGNAHMGHVRVYAISDAVARLSRFRGFETLHPLGWDAFGLPAENAAIQNNADPAEWTQRNIATMKDEQFSRLGLSFDLGQEINSASPEFYTWTQWLFQTLYDHDLVYRANGWVNWDPVDQTVLANEQVIDGKGWRSGAPVERRQLPQWYVRITRFAQALWDGLETLQGHWSDEAIAVQRGWIGRSEGVEIAFPLLDADGGETGQSIACYTTRADTIYGVTSITLAPEHPLVKDLAAPKVRDEVEAYIAFATNRSELERETAERTGVALGAKARNPLTGEDVPVYISEYVLGGYGTGAIMNVPAHDARDFDFAKTNGLPIRQVILPAKDAPESDLEEAYTDAGFMTRSGRFDGMPTHVAKQAIIDHLVEQGLGTRKVNFRLRDWLISRQRFWGAPIPMVHSDEHGWAKAPDLPVMLPKEVDFSQGSGKAMASAPGFLETTFPGTGDPAIRETDTMDTFMCSSWYAWRYLDAKNADVAFREGRAKDWMPIDYYVGGLEHASQHLIYFRFISHFLHSIGMTPTAEPVKNFLDNGLVKLGGEKMSKSKGNVVIPTEAVDRYGADALRLYILADTPLRRDIDWDDSGIEGKQRFLSQIWTLTAQIANAPALEGAPSPQTDAEKAAMRELAKIAKEVVEDLEQRRGFHNAIARLHSFVGEMRPLVVGAKDAEKPLLRHVMAEFMKVLGVFAPHMAEYLWGEAFGMEGSLFAQAWPDPGEQYLVADALTISIQVNGKLRATVSVPADAGEEEVVAVATADAKVAEYLAAGTLRRTIFVPGRLVNFVVT